MQGPGQTAQDLELQGLAGLRDLDHLAQRHHGEAVDGGSEPHGAEALAGAQPGPRVVVRSAHDDQAVRALDLTAPDVVEQPGREPAGSPDRRSRGRRQHRGGHAVAGAVVDPGLLLAADLGVAVLHVDRRG